jgi:hypothetical protein
MQFFHVFFELGHFLKDLTAQRFLVAHGLQPFVCGFCVWRVFVIVCWLSNGQSVIEEKGEGFENGKVVFGLLVVPSTSITLHSHVIRLKI